MKQICFQGDILLVEPRNVRGENKQQSSPKIFLNEQETNSPHGTCAFTEPKNSLIETVEYFNRFLEAVRLVEVDQNDFGRVSSETRLSFIEMPSEEQAIEFQKTIIQSSGVTWCKWLPEEKQLLDWVVIKYSIAHSKLPSELGDEDWKSISCCIASRSPGQCKQKWISRAIYSIYRHPWKAEEDEALLEIQSELVKQGFFNKWERVSRKLREMGVSPVPRPAKQCRERWVNKVDPEIDKGGWNDDDDLCILYILLEKGKRWAEIKRKLSKRKAEFCIRQRFEHLVLLHKKQFTKDKKLLRNTLNHIREKLWQDKLIDSSWERQKQLFMIFMISKIEEQQKHFANPDKRILTPFSNDDTNFVQKIGLVNLKSQAITLLTQVTLDTIKESIDLKKETNCTADTDYQEGLRANSELEIKCEVETREPICKNEEA